MEKYLKFDDQVTVLTKHKELQQYLQFRKENDVWVQPYIKETTVVGIEDHPLFLSQYFLSNGIELNDESNECVKDTGMFLTFPMNGKEKSIQQDILRLQAFANAQDLAVQLSQIL